MTIACRTGSCWRSTCAAHDAEGDVGVLGHIAWHPEIEVTPFMSFLEEGVQFGFMHIADAEDVPVLGLLHLELLGAEAPPGRGGRLR